MIDPKPAEIAFHLPGLCCQYLVSPRTSGAIAGIEFWAAPAAWNQHGIRAGF